MLKKYLVMVVASSLTVISCSSFAYGNRCNSRDYMCYETRSGKVVAVPRQHKKNYGYREYGYRDDGYQNHGYRKQTKYRKHREQRHEVRHYAAPPEKISSGNIINVDLGNLTWGAYDHSGNLVKYGRVSGGKNYCPDIGRRCRTVTGTFTIYSKKGAGCKSTKFPVGKGGAPMPYCMFFKGGYALHGSNAVPGYNASHGCVRMPPSDAQWLNQNFVSVGSTRVNVHY